MFSFDEGNTVTQSPWLCDCISNYCNF